MRTQRNTILRGTALRMGLLTTALFCLPLLAATAQPAPAGHWELDEGTGNLVVNDQGPGKHNGKLINPAGVQWAHEDSRGFYLRFLGEGDARIEIADAAAFRLQEAFTLVTEFAFAGSGMTRSAPVICKGAATDPDYGITVTREGTVTVRLSGTSPAEFVLPSRISPDRDCTVSIAYDGRALTAYLGTKLIKAFPCTGRVRTSAAPLMFGGAPGAAFAGSLYGVRIFARALNAAELTALTAASIGEPAAPNRKQKAVGTSAPRSPKTTSLQNPDAIVFHDFSKLQPPGAVQPSSRVNTWYLRTKATFMAAADNVLHLGAGGEWPDLTYAPNLKGRYNLYIGMRGAGQESQLQLKTDAMAQYATVRLKSHDPIHVNYDILWAADVPMDGRTIEIHAVGGNVYLDYLSFVPAAQDGKEATISRFVTMGTRQENTDLASYLSEHDERVYRAPTPMPALHPESHKRGFMLFTRPWMDLVFPNAIPASDTDSVELVCQAARGEYEPVTFSLRALRDLNSLSVVLEQPPTTGAATLSSDAVDIRRVRCLQKRTTRYTGRSEYMNMPTYAERTRTHSVSSDATQTYWITIHVPNDAPAGKYIGRVTIREEERTVATIPLSVNVYPFELAPLQDINLGMYYAPRSPPASAGDRQALLDTFRDMSNHGLNSVAWFLPLDAPIAGEFPDVEIDVENSSISLAMEAFRESGMDGDFLWCYHSFTPQIGHLLPDEEAYQQAHIAITTAILAEAAKRRWPRIIFQPYDEVPSHRDQFPALLRELRCLKKAGATTEHDHLWLKTNRGDTVQDGIDQCAPLIDVFTLRYSTKPIFYVDPWQEITRQAHALGKELYTYNINNGLAISELESMRFGTGWFFRSLGKGCRGYYLWTCQRGTGSFYNDFDGSTDWVQNYPESRQRWNTLGGPALYWEALREGIDDLKYIQHLERLILTARVDPVRKAAARRATDLLAKLTGSIDVEKLQHDCVFLECQWERSGTDEDGSRWAEGRFQLPNGWTFERYDDARRAVADMITELDQ